MFSFFDHKYYKLQKGVIKESNIRLEWWTCQLKYDMSDISYFFSPYLNHSGNNLI